MTARLATGGGCSGCFNLKNLVALVLVTSVLTVSILTRGPQVHGYICFFDEATCSRAQQPGARTFADDAKANRSDAGEAGPAAPVCKLADMYKLIACKGGGFNDACCRGYQHFFHQNCVCSYDAWPRQYVGDDMSAMTWVRNIMQCNMSYAEVASNSACIEQASTCAKPVEGDLLLSSHPRGLVLLWRDGAWGRVTGSGLTADVATNVCRRLGYAGAVEQTDRRDIASRYEHDLPSEAELANGTEQASSALRIGVPEAVHQLNCKAGALPKACPLNVPAPIPLPAVAAHDPAASPSPSPSNARPANSHQPQPHPAPRPRPAPHPSPRTPSSARGPRGSHAAPGASGGDEPGAWVIGCGLELEHGGMVAGPQNCWLGRDGSRQCAGDASVATLACGTSVPRRTH